MKPIKISIFGADGYTCQMPRIKEAMQNLGHILSEDSPELIYSNDPTGYEKAMFLKKKFPNSFLIFNFLDVPWHMPNVDKQTKLLVENFLAKSDAVTAISYKVKQDLAKFLDKKIEVIYNPIKDVFYDESIKKNNNSNIGILFGPERSGLNNNSIALCDKIIEIPLNKKFNSLNLAQSVLLVAYELFNFNLYKKIFLKTTKAKKSNYLTFSMF